MRTASTRQPTRAQVRSRMRRQLRMQRRAPKRTRTQMRRRTPKMRLQRHALWAQIRNRQQVPKRLDRLGSFRPHALPPQPPLLQPQRVRSQAPAQTRTRATSRRPVSPRVRCCCCQKLRECVRNQANRTHNRPQAPRQRISKLRLLHHAHRSRIRPLLPTRTRAFFGSWHPKPSQFGARGLRPRRKSTAPPGRNPHLSCRKKPRRRARRRPIPTPRIRYQPSPRHYAPPRSSSGYRARPRLSPRSAFSGGRTSAATGQGTSRRRTPCLPGLSAPQPARTATTGAA